MAASNLIDDTDYDESIAWEWLHVRGAGIGGPTTPGNLTPGTFDATAAYNAITIATKDSSITGGSASFDVKAHRTVTGTDMAKGDVDKSFEVHADLTFNADNTATLVLDGTQTFTIDLDTGKITKPAV